MSNLADRFYLTGHKSIEIKKNINFRTSIIIIYELMSSESKRAVTMTEMINDRRCISNSLVSVRLQTKTFTVRFDNTRS